MLPLVENASRESTPMSIAPTATHAPLVPSRSTRPMRAPTALRVPRLVRRAGGTVFQSLRNIVPRRHPGLFMHRMFCWPSRQRKPDRVRALRARALHERVGQVGMLHLPNRVQLSRSQRGVFALAASCTPLPTFTNPVHGGGSRGLCTCTSGAAGSAGMLPWLLLHSQLVAVPCLSCR